MKSISISNFLGWHGEKINNVRRQWQFIELPQYFLPQNFLQPVSVGHKTDGKGLSIDPCYLYLRCLIYPNVGYDKGKIKGLLGVKHLRIARVNTAAQH